MYQYRLLPVFADLLPANSEMMAYIESVEAPFRSRLDEPLAVAEDLLYRRGNFNGTFDQIICDALRQELNAEVALSPGFRWGTTVLPGEIITMARVLDQTAMTYPETYVRLMKGAEEVVVATVAMDASASEHQSLADVAEFLKRHGIRARSEVLIEKHDSAALTAFAASMHADLIVAGAYSHSRLRELIFGGVTRVLFDETGLHRLMSS